MGTFAAVMKDAAGGLAAGNPQVLLTQAEVRFLGMQEEQADIGPRFLQNSAWRLDSSLSRSEKWMIAGAFHFAYAAGWGMFYALLQRRRPAQPHVGGPLLAALIYTLAFSTWGAATPSGTERPAERRSARESLLHWTAALAFSLTTAYLYAWFDQWPRATERRPSVAQ